MKNQEISEMFNRMAVILEFRGEMAFKVNAYRRAARNIKDLGEDIVTLWKSDRLDSIPGVGAGLAKKIDEFLSTGTMTKYVEIVHSVPTELIDLLSIQNLGPRTLAMLHEQLGVHNLMDLKQVISDGRLAKLPGMGQKKVENIVRGIEIHEHGIGRIPLGLALPLVKRFIHELRQHPQIGRIYPAGSIRRMRETVGDIDILAETDHGKEVIQSITTLPQVSEVVGSGSTKASILTENHIQVDFRAVERDSFGAALQYFTGSQAHNVHLRRIAKNRGFKINEYGLFDRERKIGGETEEEIYETLGLSWIPPELREDHGEVEAALENRLPKLVDLYDIQGDFHVHTDWSDGSASIEEMAKQAESLGYSFIAICDHSQAASYAGGLSPQRVMAQIKEIRQLNEEQKFFRILAGTEVDILSDGSLDLPDEILIQLDIVIAAIHSGFKQNVTQRMVKAAQHPLVDIIAHPTGRIIGKREGYQVDLEAVMQACRQTHTALEINSYYERLDLNDVNVKRARELGIPIAIGTDAHRPADLASFQLGLSVARRGWLEKKDVMNCLSVDEIKKLCIKNCPAK